MIIDVEGRFDFDLCEFTCCLVIFVQRWIGLNSLSSVYTYKHNEHNCTNGQLENKRNYNDYV